jgi:hypothetical protein
MGKFIRLLSASILLPAFLFARQSSDAAPAPVDGTSGTSIAVSTYHYGIERTGWNYNEQVLNASSFPSTFGVLKTVTLDDQVDAQPLLVPGLHIAGGVHDVLYVVTEHNSVYAIDANSGAVLLQRNLGSPVPPLFGCTNNPPHVGIMSTPVIDLTKREIILIAYVNGATPSYRLHALNLTTLADAVTPVTVAATKTLTDGTTFEFNAANQRQRPGLLEMNSVIYAGFGSFCDYNASVSRGWVLGWSVAGTKLAPLASAKLNDTQATSPTDWFLSSVWMSGFGIAGDGNHVFFTTANSDCDVFAQPVRCASKSTYDGVTDIQESIVGMDPDLGSQGGIFTPNNVQELDSGDLDLSAGGVMLIPNTGIGYNLATAAGKDGRLFLIDRDSMSTALDVKQLPNGCWCGPSYFLGSDGIGRIVTSAGATLQTWRIQTSPGPHLVHSTCFLKISEELNPLHWFQALGQRIGRGPFFEVIYVRSVASTFVLETNPNVASTSQPRTEQVIATGVARKVD